MSLQEKILKLRMDAVLAARHAAFWQKLITEHGEDKATAFYTHLGLNHIEKKSVEFDGLTLRREPRETEKIAVKGVSQAQESSREKITTILLGLRTELISDGLKGIKKLPVSQYHELTLTASPEIRTSLRDRLIKTHRTGRLLVARELGFLPKGFTHEAGCNEKFVKNDPPGYQCQCEWKQGDDEDEFDELDTLTDLTDSKVINETQARLIAAATRAAFIGLVGVALIEFVRQEMADGSVSYIDKSAIGAANKVINLGRYNEMRSRADSIERYEQSELLDANTCDPCAADDGKESSNIDDLPGAPNPSCEGGDFCRGFIVAIAEGSM